MTNFEQIVLKKCNQHAQKDTIEGRVRGLKTPLMEKSINAPKHDCPDPILIVLLIRKLDLYEK